MSVEVYGRVIQEWCGATGMTPWEPAEDMNVEVDGTVVGLIYNGDLDPGTLHLYFDLGHLEYPDLHKTLLQANALIEPDGHGYFALHPESGSVVYRSDLALTEQTSGSALPELLGSLLDVARQRVLA